MKTKNKSSIIKDKKAKNQTAEITKTKKSKKTQPKEELKEENSKEIASQITEKKELKYIYPADAEVGASKAEIKEKRKKFRAKTRAKLESLTKAFNKANATGVESDITKATKALSRFKKETLVLGNN